MAKRITYSANFKKKVALAALKENKTLSELAQEFKIYPSQIVKWKSQAIEGLEDVFDDKRKKKKESDTDIEAVYAQLGKTQSQLEFLKKKTGIDC
jgi:transposase-like protein